VRSWSEYLAFLRTPAVPSPAPRAVNTTGELLAALRAALPTEPVAYLVSGGVDSRLLWALAPTGSRAYTVAFDGLDPEPTEGTQVPVSWHDYQQHHDALTARKGCALTGVEPAVFTACLQAARDGFDTIVSGVLADAHFGDVAGLHTAPDPLRAYFHTHIHPPSILHDAVDVSDAIAPYLTPSGLDTIRFVTELAWGDGLAFTNAAALAGLRHVAPYSLVRAERPTAGKPLVTQAYQRVTRQPVPAKVGFSRPMRRWLAGYTPTRPEFKPLPKLRATRLFYVWSLERWMNLGS
jgi:hypothetical protein